MIVPGLGVAVGTAGPTVDVGAGTSIGVAAVATAVAAAFAGVVAVATAVAAAFPGAAVVAAAVALAAAGDAGLVVEAVAIGALALVGMAVADVAVTGVLVCSACCVVAVPVSTKATLDGGLPSIRMMPSHAAASVPAAPVITENRAIALRFCGAVISGSLRV